MSKTVSARLKDNKHDELRERCNQLGCSVNDFVKASVEFALDGSSEFDFGDEEPKERIEKKLAENQNLSEFRPHYDSHGNYYTYDENTKKWTCHLNMDNARITP